MVAKTWMDAKKHIPVDTFSRRFFDMAEILEIKLEGLSPERNPEKAYFKLIRSSKEFQNFIQRMQRNLNKVYSKAPDHRDEAKAVYKLIDVNLRFYRFAQIDQVKERISGGGGNPSPSDVEELRTGHLSIMETIKECMIQAAKEFEQEDDVDDEVVYLVDLAYQVEISLRFFAKHMSREKENERVIDYYKVREQTSNKKDLLDKIKERMEEVSETTEESIEEMEEELEKEMQQAGNGRSRR